MKVGDYVRTHGYIDKIININDFREPSMKYALEQPSWNDDVIFIGEEDITKSSPKIIDLIEVGDYVNDEKIVGIGCLTNGPEEGTKTIDYYIAPNTVYYFKNEDIKSIVTKEQFESMEYEVK